MPEPRHTTEMVSHLWIAHCVIVRQGKERDGDLEEVHRLYHQHPAKGTIHHVHTPRPDPPADQGHGFW